MKTCIQRHLSFLSVVLCLGTAPGPAVWAETVRERLVAAAAATRNLAQHAQDQGSARWFSVFELEDRAPRSTFPFSLELTGLKIRGSCFLGFPTRGWR
jgi:hypothetical protein